MFKPDASQLFCRVPSYPAPAGAEPFHADTDRNLFRFYFWKLSDPVLVTLDFNFLFFDTRVFFLPVHKCDGRAWNRKVILGIRDLETESLARWPRCFGLRARVRNQAINSGIC